jgi:hypothetical protein
MAWRTRPTYLPAQADDQPPVLVTTLPAGYSATLPNLTIGQAFTRPPVAMLPLLGAMTIGDGNGPSLGTPARDPSIGAFIRDSVPAGTIGRETGRAPAWAPDGRIGRLIPGQSPIGRRPLHRAVTVPGGGLPETEQ